MAECTSVADLQSLQELFKEGWGAQKKIESDELCCTSDEYQGVVVKGLKCLEDATRMTNKLSLFSTNETLEDVATADLKYLLLPALLGDLTLQVREGDRLELIQRARVYFIDYLQRCRSYAITTEDPPARCDHSPSASGPAPPPKRSYEQLAVERATRIAKLKEQKQLERKLKELTVRVELSLVSPRHQVDDEVVRDHALTLLRVWVLRCQDHVRSLDQEAELLEGMEKHRGGANDWKATPPDPGDRKPMKPVVITKQMLQSKVFGAGYPSLPTMSVEEFFDQRYKEETEQRKLEESSLPVRVYDNSMVGGARGRKVQETEEEGEDEKAKEEDEDESEEAIKKARDWDEFKDDNRRGWGNKKNMG